MSKEMNILLRKEIKRILESLLFSCHEPVALKKLKDVVADFHPLTNSELESILQELKEDYQMQQRAFLLDKNEMGYFLHTREEYSPYVAQLHSEKKGERISRGATEVLAIIAHKQPITRPMIEAIRGVDSGGSLQALLERELIETGSGKPTPYKTTQKFLQHFGLKAVSELTSNA